MRGTYVWSKKKRQFHKNAKQWIKQIQDNGWEVYSKEISKTVVKELAK